MENQGSINLPQIGQYGENSIHRFNGIVATNTMIPRSL